MNDVAGVFLEKADQGHEGERIMSRVEGLNKMFKGGDLHMVVLNQFYEPAPGRTGQFRFETVIDHPLHGEEGVDARTADDGQGVDVEYSYHAQSTSCFKDILFNQTISM